MLKDEKIKNMYRKWFLTDEEYLNQIWKHYKKLKII